ncbi:hypothetical protein Tco_0836315 [Tanacetum coccineum]
MRRGNSDDPIRCTPSTTQPLWILPALDNRHRNDVCLFSSKELSGSSCVGSVLVLGVVGCGAGDVGWQQVTHLCGEWVPRPFSSSPLWFLNDEIGDCDISAIVGCCRPSTDGSLRLGSRMEPDPVYTAYTSLSYNWGGGTFDTWSLACCDVIVICIVTDGSGSILFCIVMAYNEETKKTLGAVSLYKLDMTSIKWEELDCLRDWDRTDDTPAFDAELADAWECRLDGDNADPKLEEKDNEMVVRRISDDGHGVEDFSQSHLLNLPLHILEMTMEHCACLECLNFRATCKRCHSVAPSKELSDKSTLRRMFGWLLFYIDTTLVFYNPFTSDIRKFPHLGYDEGSFCFSAPPTSPDCMVVLLPKKEAYVYIHLVVREPSWHRIELDYSYTFCFPTFYGRDLYALCDNGELHVFKDLDLGGDDYSFKDYIAGDPESCCTSRDQQQHFLTKCDQHLLLVIVGLSGESVEVFKLNNNTKEWEKVDSIGRNMIYICRTTCLCIEAKS